MERKGLLFQIKDWLSILALIFGFSLLFYNCTKVVFKSGDFALGVSTDTLRFDTVFTGVGSSTRILKIYNPYNEWIKIDKIFLEKGSQSKFRINVDGSSGLEHNNLEIAPNDSLYVFAAVTVDPNQPLSVSPFVFDENLVIQSSQKSKTIVLEAWGQNANYIPNRFSKGRISYYSNNFREIKWDDSKPYVIYGAVLFDSCTLTMPAGCKVYVHGGYGRDSDKNYYNDGLLIIGPRARLNIQGTKERPVIIQADRLESDYQDIPGQWGGIILANNSRNNYIKYGEIKNAVLGIRADSTSQLTLVNSKIQNMTSIGIYSDYADIKAENCLITDCGLHCIALTHGGTYQFDYCTVANYSISSAGNGKTNDVFLVNNFKCFDAECKNAQIFPINLVMKNSILFSSGKDALGLVDGFDGNTPGVFNYTIENCAIKSEEIIKSKGFEDFFTKIKDCVKLKSNDKLFKGINQKDYRLDSLSVVEKKAIPIGGILNDIIQKSRDSTSPDIGCYEF